MKIWHRFLSEKPQTAILEALSRVHLVSDANELVEPQGPGIVFFDAITPQLYELLRDVSRRGLERVLAIAVSRADLKAAASWRLLEYGASDVFAWDHSDDPAGEIEARFERWEKVDEIVQSSLVKKNLTGHSSPWIRVLRQIIEVAHFTDASVLITGESGTGKELIARLIHTLDSRKNKRELVVLDCTTIVPELSGSEFFGHERGAFTGAVTARDGAFALADGGTLFLDEVGELPLTLQAELLRVVQEHTYKRVGSNVWQHTEFRLECATNKDLPQEAARGQFRRDFYYRIAGWACHLPPLREREEDILPLARHFIEKLRPDDPPGLDDTVREYLMTREYPGNVRELKQLVSRLLHRHAGPGPITIGAVPEEERPIAELEGGDWRDPPFEQAVRRALSQGIGLKEIGRAAEDTAERIALEAEQGNLQRAAHKLGVTDRALQMRRAARRQNGPASTHS